MADMFSERASSDTAELKLKRASERIAELDAFLADARPFSYVLQTNTITGERATLAKKNQAAADEAAAIAGDAVHNIRTALDHAYWDIVSPFATTKREQRAVQFPFCEEASRLEQTAKSRFADRVGGKFFNAIKALKPYKEEGGNRLLYAIELLDIPDKHRLLIPVAEYKELDARIIRRQVPDFPNIFNMIAAGVNGRDVVWRSTSIDPTTLGELVPPTYFMFEKKLDVPVQIILPIGELSLRTPMVATLHNLAQVARHTIRIMRNASTT